MLHSTKPHSYKFTIHTDASGFWGCVAFMSGQWLQCKWPREWVPQGIMAKELVPIVLSCIVWRPKQPVLILCDNLSLVNVITKGSSKDLTVMQLLQSLWFFTTYFDILLVTFPGKHWTCLNSLKAMECYYSTGTSPATQRSYLAGLKRYTTFCSQAKLKPMPTTEAILLLFVTHLASQNLACTTIKVLPCCRSECSCGCRKA